MVNAPTLRYPRLPVLGWSAFSRKPTEALPGVMDATNRRYTVSGRAAIGVALQALGVGPGDRVLVPTYHCPTMITPIVAAGATPVFYPIGPTGGPSLAWLREQGTRQAHAMLVAHYFGIPQAMAGIRALCDENRLALIEDCAHAFFGVSDGRAVGGWGDVAIASLTKFFPVPEGGLVASNRVPLRHLQLWPRSWTDELRAIADAVQVGAEHGALKGLNTPLQALFGAKAWLGRKARAEHSQAQDLARADIADPLIRGAEAAGAALWITRHVHPGRIAACRRRNYARLARRLSGLRGGYPLVKDLPAAAVPYVFPLYVHRAEELYQPLRRTGIPVFRWDQVWPGSPALEGDLGLAWSKHVFQLGCHQDLGEDDIERIASIVQLIVDGEGGEAS
jgi:dTDP-4-amino-4,6-dideoxygalactose transaminase